MDINFIKNEFIKKHKVDNMDYLNEYINLIFNYKLNETNEYTENHHILPVCTFPEFSGDFWNIVQLKYEDHILAHLLLFRSINIRSYQRPLNWMLNTYKNSEEISNAAKNGWKNLKANEIKYKKWIEKRSNHMKKLSSEEQRRRSNIFWENISEDEYLNYSKKMKELWTEDRRKEKSKQMIDYYSNPENVAKKSIETKNRWDSLDKDYRENFRNKMSLINKDEDKRSFASKKIKELWKNDEFLEKMKNRKKRSGLVIKVIQPDGKEFIVESLKKLSIDFNISPFLIRKYIDKDIEIKEENLGDNKLLLNCKLKTIK